MFDTMVESTSQAKDAGRRSAFMAVTFVIWVVGFTGLVIWQVWTAAAELSQSANDVTLLAPPPPP
ncbi:MAG: hypothetical protein CFK52_07465, partial [Chloracidobacterium sp. CP2_5A]